MFNIYLFDSSIGIREKFILCFWIVAKIMGIVGDHAVTECEMGLAIFCRINHHIIAAGNDVMVKYKCWN